jgi:hypothetical protein
VFTDTSRWPWVRFLQITSQTNSTTSVKKISTFNYSPNSLCSVSRTTNSCLQLRGFKENWSIQFTAPLILITWLNFWCDCSVLLAKKRVFRSFSMKTSCVSCVNLIGLVVVLMATVILLASYDIEAYPLYIPNRTPTNRVKINDSSMEGTGTMNVCPPGTRLTNGICRTPYGRWLPMCTCCVVEVGARLWLC